ncbi:MAG: peptidase U32 family protein [bacterium]
MTSLELLMPAGNIEKLEYAIEYGADAIYLGLTDYSLRTMRSGDVITQENLKQAIEIAHSKGKNVYCTLNIFAHNHNISKLESDLEIIKDANPDAIIFGDLGVYNLIKKCLPDMPLHVSTQANTLNYEAVKFWQDMGATRVILARELALKEIEEIHNKVPDMELEMLVQGAQCVSYSGRCLLSDSMTHNERKSNQGFCAQPCRWKYYLVEETRLSEPYEIGENEHGTYILSPKDLALIKYLPEIAKAGICSIKIEGRTKSMYYAANVAKTYRIALDAMKNEQSYDADVLLSELKKVGNRGFTTGFALGKVPEDEYRYESSTSSQGARFYAIIKNKDENGYLCKMKYKLEKGEKVEIFNPKNQSEAEVLEIKDLYGNDLDVANTNQELYLKFNQIDWLENDCDMAIIRSVGE